LIAEHDDHPVAAPHAVLPQPARDLIRSGGQRAVGPRTAGAVLFDDDQRVPIGMFLRDHVEPFERPVQPARPRPLEAGDRSVVVVAVLEQEVPCRPQFRGGFGRLCRHRRRLLPVLPCGDRPAARLRA